MGILLVLSTVGLVSGTQPYTSPGANQTYSLSWLADNTDAMDYSQEGDCYFLVDDITISSTDTIEFEAGETLYIYPDTKLLVNGNLNIFGESNDKVVITMSNGVKSDSLNLEWNYDSGDPNTLTINYLDLSFCLVEITNSDGITHSFEPDYATMDDVPTYEPSSASILVDSSPPLYYAASHPDIWNSVWYPLLFDLDYDDDGMLDWWEMRNGLDWDDPDDWAYDPDSDGLNNRQEFNHKTNPRVPDTDGDSLEDGDEVFGNGGTNDYDSNPRKKYSDEDDLRDDWEVTIEPLDDNDYETDPLDGDTDEDTLYDDDEIDDGTDPTKKDTDDDYLDDNRDGEPTDFNRKFAFIFEINYYNTPISDRDTKACWYVANKLDVLGWDVYLYTDHNYNTDTDLTNNLRGGVAEQDTVYSVCTWGNFEAAWEDFWDRDNSGTWNTGDVGKEDSSEYGTDTVFIYLDGDGETGGNTFEMRFPKLYVGNKLVHESIGVDNLEDTLGNLGSCIDVIWLQIPNSDGWNGDIGNSDGLGAGDRFLIYTDSGIDDDYDVFEYFIDYYEDDMDSGFKSAWDEMSAGEKDDHMLNPKFTGTYYIR